MNILIIGCGKVGSNLANLLARKGHDVSVIDKSAESFDLLDDDFTGLTVTGVPIDQDVLRAAGIEACDAVAALTPNDNINIMASQLAKEIFHIPRVLTRVYDPQREETFAHFGLKTICPTNLTVEAVHAMLNDHDDLKHLTFDTATVSFSAVKVPKDLVGSHVSEFPDNASERLFAVLREGGNMHLIGRDSDLVLKQNDQLIIAKQVD